IDDNPVTIKSIECAIVDRGWREGWIEPVVPEWRTSKRVAVVGSGPAGLAAAQQLARAGHWVTVFEKSDRIGGLLRYGIPNFKMEKQGIDRRMEQMEAEGVEVITKANNTSPDDLAPATPWPMWPLQLRIESSHEEGGVREWAMATTSFEGDAQGNVKKLHGVRVGPGPKFAPIKGSEFILDAELVLLAMGFTGP